MKVQGRLMQARFIEIHQVFTKKKGPDTFLTNLALYMFAYRLLSNWKWVYMEQGVDVVMET